MSKVLIKFSTATESYLGCPLFVGSMKKSYFDPLVDKVITRINSWSNHLMSFGGRITLIKYVLQSLPVYTMAALAPPVSVTNDLERIYSNFLWGKKDNGLRYHWVSWTSCCNPVEEGALSLEG